MDMIYGDGESGLGLAPLIPAAAAVVSKAPVVKSVVKSVGNLFAGYDKDKDANRRATNSRAYDLAVAAHEKAAYRFLQGRSGKYGNITVAPLLPGITDKANAIIGGWASAPARDDANAKYDVLKGQGFDDLTVAEQAAVVAQSPVTKAGVGVLVGLALLGMAMSGGTSGRRKYRRNPSPRRRRSARR